MRYAVLHSLVWAWLLAGCSGSGTAVRDASGTEARDATIQADGSVVDPCGGPCNAMPPSNPILGEAQGEGDITMYATQPSKGGACNYGQTGINTYAAVNVNVVPGDGQGEWQEGRICGQCVDIQVQTSTGPRSVIVRIADKCADGFCGMDLGGLAPAQVMSDGFGRYRGSWRFVSCDGHPEVSDGPPSLYVMSGSNSGWAAVQVRNPPWPVAVIYWEQQGTAARGSLSYAGLSLENAFMVPLEVLQANASFTLTIRFTDGSSTALSLTSAQLASEHAYPLGP